VSVHQKACLDYPKKTTSAISSGMISAISSSLIFVGVIALE
jgi:hypothetical protein